MWGSRGQGCGERGAHLMLSRRLESGLSTDELRTILCRVTMRNTRFTCGGRGRWAGLLRCRASAWAGSAQTPSLRASSAGGPVPRCLHRGSHGWEVGAPSLTQQGLRSQLWDRQTAVLERYRPLCSHLSWLLSPQGFQGLRETGAQHQG